MCENNNCPCLAEVLETILTLQQRQVHEDCLLGCTKPFLGNHATSCFNTRPVSLQACCVDKKWTFPATINGMTIECDVFRIENINDCCATFRCLTSNPAIELVESVPYIATNDFFTIDLNCVSALKCHEDTNILGV